MNNWLDHLIGRVPADLKACGFVKYHISAFKTATRYGGAGHICSSHMSGCGGRMLYMRTDFRGRTRAYCLRHATLAVKHHPEWQVVQTTDSQVTRPESPYTAPQGHS